MRSFSFEKLKLGDLTAKNFLGPAFLCAIKKKKKTSRTDTIGNADVLELRGHAEHRMHIQPPNATCTTLKYVYISSSQKATFALVLTKAIYLVLLPAAWGNSLTFPSSSVLKFARQYQFSDSKESKVKMKS